MINPSLLFNNSEKVLHGLIPTGSLCSDLLYVEALSTESLVQCLSDEDISGVGAEVVNHGEKNGDEARREERWPVVHCGVDPAKEEVVVTVGKPLSLPEELLSRGLVETGSSFLGKRHVRNMEISVSCPLLPVSPVVALDTLVRPVPSIL